MYCNGHTQCDHQPIRFRLLHGGTCLRPCCLWCGHTHAYTKTSCLLLLLPHPKALTVISFWGITLSPLVSHCSYQVFTLWIGGSIQLRSPVTSWPNSCSISASSLGASASSNGHELRGCLTCWTGDTWEGSVSAAPAPNNCLIEERIQNDLYQAENSIHVCTHNSRDRNHNNNHYNSFHTVWK